MDDILDFTRASLVSGGPGDDGPKRRHHWLLPPRVRALLVGPSGSGKTNLLLNLILRPGGLAWDRIYLVGPGLEDQPGYQKLKEVADELELKAEDKDKVVATPLVVFVPSVADAPTPEDLDPKIRNLIVFDDVMLEKQGAAEMLFSRGRHRGADVVYLFQKYTAVPKVVRDNANLLLLFHGVDGDAVRRVHSVWCSADMDLNEFSDFFRRGSEEPYSHTTIDLTRPPYAGKYRARFKAWYTPSLYTKLPNAKQFTKMQTPDDAERLAERYLESKQALHDKQVGEVCGRQLSDQTFEKDFRLILEPVRAAVESLEIAAKDANLPITPAPAPAPASEIVGAFETPVSVSTKRTGPALTSLFTERAREQILKDPVGFASRIPTANVVKALILNESSTPNSRRNWSRWVYRELTGSKQARGPNFEIFESEVRRRRFPEDFITSSSDESGAGGPLARRSAESVTGVGSPEFSTATSSPVLGARGPPVTGSGLKVPHKVVYLSGPKEAFNRVRVITSAACAGNSSEVLRNEGRELCRRLLKDKDFSPEIYQGFMSVLE